MTKAQEMLEFIETHLSNGLTIYICTARNAIKVSPKTVAKFNDGGHKLFKFDSEGNLRIASGKNFNIICHKNMSLVTVKASAS
jgi:hypothetical protein